MAARIQKILKILTENGSSYTTAESLAASIGAGTRTIYRNLDQLEKKLHRQGRGLERRRGYGVRLLTPEDTAADFFGKAPFVSPDALYRPMMVLVYLIAAGDWLKLAEMAGALRVSASTIASDLRLLEPLLPNGMRIEKRKGRGVRLSGHEWTIRMAFLRLFSLLFPYYALKSDADKNGRSQSMMEKFLSALDARNQRQQKTELVESTEKSLGYTFSPVYRSLLYGYLFLLSARPYKPVDDTGDKYFGLPELYFDHARKIFLCGVPGLSHTLETREEELLFLATLLACCEAADTPDTKVTPIESYLGETNAPIETLIERSLGRLEKKEGVWLHNDAAFIDYLKMVFAAAIHRIDADLSEITRCFRYFPPAHSSSAAEIFVSQFLADLGEKLREPETVIVQQEIGEALFAVAAQTETLRGRHRAVLKVRILCYEGLGMSSYILTLAREVFPPGTVFDHRWDPDFIKSSQSEGYDLIISTFHLPAMRQKNLVLDGKTSPDEIRAKLCGILFEFISHPANFAAPARKKEIAPTEKTGWMVASREYPRENCRASILSVIEDFFVTVRKAGDDDLRLAVEGLDHHDCDKELLYRDFQRRESFGALRFENLNLLVLHCRSEGVPVPRAGVIQDSGSGETALVLAAPKSAKQHETYPLTEIMIKLTETPEFTAVMAREKRERICAQIREIFKELL